MNLIGERAKKAVTNKLDTKKKNQILKKYLSLIPYTWSLLHLRLKNPIFREFSAILNDYLLANKRK